MKLEKVYKIRLYINDSVEGKFLNDLLDSSDMKLVNSFDGMNGLLAIYDVLIEESVLDNEIIKNGLEFLPLNHYEDFEIICPNCGARIDDDMILKVYDEVVLSGYNIYCDRADCGTQRAMVKKTS